MMDRWWIWERAWEERRNLYTDQEASMQEMLLGDHSDDLKIMIDSRMNLPKCDTIVTTAFLSWWTDPLFRA